jgi:uncharacterized membrane-anchored protein
VLGLGNVGGAVARIGKAFGMKIIAWSQNLTADRAAEVGAVLGAREELFRQAHMLSTRLDLTTERQNQALLESMNSRARLQLRLQSTVEGLSVAAVTYYVSALVGHAAEALRTEGLHVDPDLATGISIPIVALIAWFGIHHIRKTVTRRSNA